MIKTLALALGASLVTLSAQAATVLDSLNVNRDPYVFRTNEDGVRAFALDGRVLGQSFVLASDTGNLSIEALLSTFNNRGRPNIDVSVALLRGAGLDGDVLGAQTFVSGPATRRDILLRDFDFSSAGTLAAGTYTVRFAGFGALGGADVQGGVGLDAEGTAFDATGPFAFGSNPAQDFGLRVIGDVVVAPVPLPAGLPLVLTALGALGLVRRRRA